MINFYSNENLPFELVRQLRLLGYDLLTSFEAGNANQSIDDLSVLRYAQSTSRVLITLNREDFISLHRQGENHSGLIICKEDRDYQGQALTIHDFLLKNNQSLARRLIRIKKQNQKGFSTQVFVVQEY